MQHNAAGPQVEQKKVIEDRIVGSTFCNRMIDTLSLSAFQALERDIPPTYVASAANHPLSSSGY